MQASARCLHAPSSRSGTNIRSPEMRHLPEDVGMVMRNNRNRTGKRERRGMSEDNEDPFKALAVMVQAKTAAADNANSTPAPRPEPEPEPELELDLTTAGPEDTPEQAPDVDTGLAEDLAPLERTDPIAAPAEEPRPDPEPEPAPTANVKHVIDAWASTMRNRRSNRATFFRYTEMIAGFSEQVNVDVPEGLIDGLTETLSDLASAEDNLADLSESAAQALGLPGPRDPAWVSSIVQMLEESPDSQVSWWSTPDPQGIIRLAEHLHERYDTAARTGDRLGAKYGPELARLPSSQHADFAARISSLRRTAMPLVGDTTVDDFLALIEFAKASRSAMQQVAPVIEELGSILGTDLLGLPLGTVHRLHDLARKLGQCGAPNPDWADGDAASFAKATVEASADTIREANSAAADLAARYTDALWSFDPNLVTVEHLERVTLPGVTPTNPASDVELFRRAAALRSELDELDDVCSRYLGALWKHSDTDIDAVLALLDGAIQIRELLGASYNTSHMRKLYGGPVFDHPEFVGPLKAADTQIREWGVWAARHGYPHTSHVSVREVLSWCDVMENDGQWIAGFIGSNPAFVGHGGDALDEVADDLSAVHDATRAVDAAASAAEGILGPGMRGADTDWDDLVERVEWVMFARYAWLGLPAETEVARRIVAGDLPDPGPIEAALDGCRAAAARVEGCLGRIL